ncbi:probable inactive purple acid phosphatase 16 [Chenopodium quinoa]|uniref:Calcineurin-like phosphoesterase domain-containing protein n=1 Tax=Chenopodium quinoa TaxID=63459 RepID=A0A803MAK1_CHEQI|nr:probable inactive purple acid phosphatase 16 [Chenopodium quinoa]
MEGQNGKQNKKFSLLKIVLLLPLIRFGSVVVAKPRTAKNLQVQKGLPFKIALFADLHFGEDAWTKWGPLQDVHSTKVMSSILDQDKPDFVIYLGDVITANNIPIANASLYWDQALSSAKNRCIPWAIVFGNHDDAQFTWPLEWFSDSGIPPLKCSSDISLSSGEDNCGFMGTTRLQLINHDIGSKTLSFSQKGPKNLWPSVSNYVLKISSSDDSESPVAYLYFLDSGGGSYPEVISSAQAKWFNSTSMEINPDSRVPEIIFWHIPSRAYKTVAPSGEIDKPCVGSINKETVAPQEAEYGIMNALEARSSVQAVFVGHNHGLDWCCPCKKFWLCFARHTGYGGYGNWARGARILEITEQPFSLKSWITMEDGSVHSHVSLKS